MNSLKGSGLAMWKNQILNLPLSEARQKVVQRAYKERSKRWSALQMAQIPEPHVVGLFVPQDKWHEPEVLPCNEHNLKPSQMAFPKLCGDELKFFLCSPHELIENARFKIPEPPSHNSNNQELTEVIPSLILIPALMVDMDGQRIGRGLGFYDRYLSANPQVQTFAVVHSTYIFQNFPNEWMKPWDQKVQGFITEKDYVILNQQSSLLVDYIKKGRGA